MPITHAYPNLRYEEYSQTKNWYKKQVILYT